MSARAERGSARGKLLDAALDVIRRQGLAGTSVDELCTAAGVTKGAFFHHFESKEALAVAAAEHWTQTTGELFAAAPFHQHRGPVDRVLGYLDLRAALMTGRPEDYSCVAGTMAQECFVTRPAVRDACGASILGHAESLESDLAEALALSGDTTISAQSLAVFTQVVLQGAFVVSKAADDPEIAIDSLANLRRYLSTVLEPATPLPTTSSPPGRSASIPPRKSRSQ